MLHDPRGESLPGPVALFDLHGQVALVTGGAGGLGRAIAVGMAAAGATVAIADTAIEAAGEILAEIETHGGRGLALPMDVTDANAVQRVVDRLQSEYARIDILVTSHGITKRMPSADLPEAEWDRIIAVNLKGVFLCCQIVGREMLRQGRGSIINLTSIGGLVALPLSVAYCASKGGVVQLTKSLATSWARQNIQVNAVLPGWIDTDLTRAARREIEGLHDRVLARTPAGRWGDPKDFAGIAAFLASSASDFVTGTAIPVDGGYSTLG